MKRFPGIAVLFSLTVLGCQNRTPAEDLHGVWHFVDIRQAASLPDSMTPPLFDSIEIQPSSVIVLQDTLRKRNFKATYTIQDDVLQWSFQPTDTPSPVEHAVHFSLRADGSLVLRSAPAKHSGESSVEWVFVRPERLLPSATVSGDWIIPARTGEADSHWILLPDGTLGHPPAAGEEESYWGVYRVWRNAEDQLILTTVWWVQGEGAFAMFQRVEPHDDAMEVTGRVPPGIEPMPQQTWRRSPQPAK